jgi:hypothetical protein
MTTNAYIRGVKNDGWPPFNKRLWQRNYHDHIIRNDRALDRLRDYVAGNPSRWAEDALHPDNPLIGNHVYVNRLSVRALPAGIALRRFGGGHPARRGDRRGG